MFLSTHKDVIYLHELNLLQIVFVCEPCTFV